MSHYIKKTLLFFISLISISFAQIDSIYISEATKSNEFSSSFEKNINTYKWIGFFFYNKIWNNFELNISENFNSNLITTSKKLYKDEQLLDLDGRYKLRENLKLILRVNSLIISDNLETGMSNISSNALFSGVEYNPFDFLIIEPALGYRSDRQMDEYDTGISYFLRMKIPEFTWQGYSNTLNTLYQIDYLTPRKLETRYFYFSNKKIFFEKTYNILNFSYKYLKRDYYFSVDSSLANLFFIKNNIEKRSENLISLTDSIQYFVSPKLKIHASGNLNYRIIDKSRMYKTLRDFDNQIKDFRLYGSTNFFYYPSKYLSGNIELSYLERNVTHQLFYEEGSDKLIYDKLKNFETQKNNYSRRTNISTNILVTLSKYSKISFSSSNSILRYDTPSKINDDDRDEIWTSYQIKTYHQLNKYLNLQFDIDANLVHIVYLYKSRSANNNWNRILRFAPRMDYNAPGEFSSTNIAEVIANYTTYDFENSGIPLKSYLFRQFAFIDSSRLNITKRLHLTFFNKILLYERGELNWKEFKSKPSNYNYDATLISQIQQSFGKNLLLSFGIRYFIQKRYKYEGRNRQLESMLTSTGPIASIDYQIHPELVLTINGWSENIKYTNKSSHINTNMLITLNRKF